MREAVQHTISADEIKALLTDRLEELAVAVLGDPNADTRRRHEWRWGRQGSAALIMQDRGGRRRGSFFSHEASAGGSPIDLIAFGRGCSVAEAFRFARTFLGLENVGREPTAEELAEQARRLAERERQQAARAKAGQAEQALKVRIARGMATASVPVTGTLAERYLVETRGIPRPSGGWPDCVRFHPGEQALLVVATDAAGEVVGVQFVLLTPDAGKVTQEEATRRRKPKAKYSHGEFASTGAAVRLPGTGAGGALLLAEGPETGLSAWAASGAETWVMLGGLREMELPSGRRVGVCADDDPRHSTGAKKLARNLRELRTAGVDVAVITPWASRRHDRSDLNDTILAGGVAAVVARIRAALEPEGPGSGPARVTVEVARQVVAEAVAGWLPLAEGWDADMAAAEGLPLPVHMIRAGVGTGKSAAVREPLIGMLTRMRARGDTRSIVVAVPMHRLSSEAAELFRVAAAGRFTVETWRGRLAPDPTTPEFADPAIPDERKPAMCADPKRVIEAQEARAQVQESACRRKLPDRKDATGDVIQRGDVVTCWNFAACAYQHQRRKRADIWVVPHSSLFHARPEAIGKVACVIVDEAMWPSGLEGEKGRPVTLPLAALGAQDRRPGEAHSADWHRLLGLRDKLHAALAGTADGSMHRDTLVVQELTPAEAREARGAELARLRDPKLHPAMTKEQRRDALKLADGNALCLRLASVWHGVEAMLADGGPVASGWLALHTGEDGARELRIKGRRDLAKGWHAPVLVLDALADPELIRPFLPTVEMTANVEAEAPHQRIIQVHDDAYSKRKLDPLDDKAAEADPTEAKRRRNRLREVRATVIRIARTYWPKRVLIVLQKGAKEGLLALGSLPANVEIGHHNGVRGLDRWGPGADREGVAALVVIGRTMPRAAEAERTTEALTGGAMQVRAEEFERITAPRLMRDGSTVLAEVSRHPDPLAEAVRAQVCEGELVQIIGRARGVNRTAENPVDVFVLTDVVLPLPVDALVSAADLAPDLTDEMLAEGGIAFDSPRDAAEAYPALWPNKEAAKKAQQRAKVGTFPPKISLWGECPHLCRVDYQRAGRGQQPATAWCDARLTPDPEAVLVALLGPLAWCRVEQPPEPHPTPPAPPDRRQRVAVDMPASPPPPQEPPMAAEQPHAPAEGRQHPAVPRPQPLPQRPPGFPEDWAPIEGMFTVRGRGGAPIARVTERSGGGVLLERVPPSTLPWPPGGAACAVLAEVRL